MFYQLCLLGALFMCVFIVFLLCCCVSAVPRLLRAHGNEIGPHPGLPDHCFEYLPDRQHGHVHLGARKGPAGQTRQGQRLDGGTQRPVAVAAGTSGSPPTPSPVAACGRARSGVCRKRWRSDLIDVFAVWWDADSTLETPPLSSRYHPWKQSVMGSISLLPFEHDSSLDRTPTLPVLEEFSPVVLGGSPASPSLWTAANPFVCVTVNRWLKKSRKGASPSGHLRPSIFLFIYLFLTVNRWDWWEPAEFHAHTI